MNGQRADGQRFSGVCKFWNAVKGYGFITATDGGLDLFVSQHDLITGDSRYRALVAGQPVECVYSLEGNKTLGKQVSGPFGANLKSYKDQYTAKRAIEKAKPLDPNKLYGTVKWFNSQKNYGFLVADDDAGDVFFHFSECLKSIRPREGDKMEYSLKDDKNGKRIAAKVKNKTQRKTTPFAPNNIPFQQGLPVPANNRVVYSANNYNNPHGSAVPYGGVYAPTNANNNNMYGTGYGVKKIGVCKFFDDARGYGFIISDNAGRDTHVHKSNILGGKLTKDEIVEYEEVDRNGKLQAVNVTRTKQHNITRHEAPNMYTRNQRPNYENPPAPSPAAHVNAHTQPTYTEQYPQYYETPPQPTGPPAQGPRYY